MEHMYIDPDITKAETLPAHFYRSDPIFDELKTKVFEKSWHWLGNADSLLPLTGQVCPISLLEHYLAEPLLLVRDAEQKVSCLSNVCTHRGNILVHHPGKVKQLVCGYHGRRFHLDGTFKMMPEFQQAENFPRPCDHLKRYPLLVFCYLLDRRKQ